ncbi:MAG: hypothetical protein AB1592_11440 [Pseudomonadota bacterium]
MAEPRPAPAPRDGWFADCNMWSGWHVKFERGRATVYVPVDQFGKLRSMSCQWCNIGFQEIRRLVEAAARERPGSRFGAKHSRERRELCERIAEYLNRCAPDLVRVLPEVPS